MANLSPYRSAPVVHTAPRHLTLIDGRPVWAFISCLLLCVAFIIIRVPRSVALACYPADNRMSMTCIVDSTMRVLGFSIGEGPQNEAVQCEPGQLDEQDWPLRGLDIALTPRHWLTATCGRRTTTVLSKEYAGRIAQNAGTDLRSFEASLRAGHPATVRLEVPWSNLELIPLVIVIAFGLWRLMGARMHAVLDPERRTLEVLYLPSSWRPEPAHTKLALRDIRAVILLSIDSLEVARSFFLGLRLANGETVQLAPYLFERERAVWRAELLRNFIDGEVTLDDGQVKIVDGRFP